MTKRFPMLLLALTVTTAGCDDMLTESPDAFITSDTYYKTPADLEAAAVAMYSLFHDWNMFKVQYHWTFELAADEGRFHPDEPNVETQAPEFLNWTTTGRDAIQPWKTLYWNVLRSHQVLDNLDKVTFADPEQKAALEAEARFMRAYNYFWLVRSYGGVPIYRSATDQLRVDAPRSTEAEVLAFIIEDVTAAVAGLPTKRSGPALGRATRGAANMLLADVHRWRANVIPASAAADWQAASNAAQAVINSGVYSLEADYAKIHDPGAQFRTEEIFSVQSIGGGGWWQSSLYGSVYWPRNLGAGGGWAVVIPTAEFYRSYIPGDYRQEATFWTQACAADQPVNCASPTKFTPVNAAGFTGGYPHVQKYLPSDRGLNFWGGGDVNIPLYRLAEAYLIYAEAQNELGNSAAAATAVNVVRARARRGTGNENRAEPSNLPVLGKAAMKDAIYKERMWELSYELKRWFDMVQRGESYFVASFQAHDPLAFQLGNVDAQHMRLPVPAEEIQKNPALTQNPGY